MAIHSSILAWKIPGTEESGGLQSAAAAAAAKSLQSCLTLCDPIDGSQPGSPIPGILQARTLEWVITRHPVIRQQALLGHWLVLLWVPPKSNKLSVSDG